MRTLILLALTLVIMPAAWLDARPGNDPNAAVRYLNAIGSLPDVAPESLKKIELLTSIEDFQKLDKETRAVLDHPRIKMVMNLLKLGAACPSCNFTPDDRALYSDLLPPFRRIRHLARVAQAYAWKCELAGDLDEAAAVLTSTFMLGQHVDDNGTLISTMIGIAVRNIAVKALSDMRARQPGFAWKAALVPFFARIPRPIANIRASLSYERQGIENSLRVAKTKPELFEGDFGFELTPQMLASVTAMFPDSGSGPAMVSVSAACQARQRLVNGAIEMLLMDYSSPLPATISADVTGSLVRLGYLTEPKTCPGSGSITITLGDSDAFRVTCSQHGEVASGAVPAADESLVPRDSPKIRYLKALAVTPEYERLLAEFLALYDALIAIDPAAADYAEQVQACMTRIEQSQNIFADAFIPNVNKAQSQADKLQKSVDALLNDL